MTKMTRDEMLVDHANLFTTARWLLAEARWWADAWRVDAFEGFYNGDLPFPWEAER